LHLGFLSQALAATGEAGIVAGAGAVLRAGASLGRATSRPMIHTVNNASPSVSSAPIQVPA
jgi:hypothetical protein